VVSQTNRQAMHLTVNARGYHSTYTSDRQLCAN